VEFKDCILDKLLQNLRKTRAKASDGAELLVTMLSKTPAIFDGQQPMLLIA